MLVRPLQNSSGYCPASWARVSREPGLDPSMVTCLWVALLLGQLRPRSAARPGTFVHAAHVRLRWNSSGVPSTGLSPQAQKDHTMASTSGRRSSVAHAGISHSFG